MEIEFKELEEMAVKEAKETFVNNWFVDNSDDIRFLDNFSHDFNKKLEKAIDRHCEETGNIGQNFQKNFRNGKCNKHFRNFK